jgi:hypothetical protein
MEREKRGMNGGMWGGRERRERERDRQTANPKEENLCERKRKRKLLKEDEITSLRERA